jgi:hypothetical protein
VDLRSGIDGADTKVKVSLTGKGSLKVAAVRGTATVVYSVEDERTRVTAEFVAATAIFRKLD